MYDDIATYEVFVCAWRNWRSVVVGVLAVVIIGKKLFLNARYCTLWTFLTYGYHKLQLVKIGSKIIVIRFCKPWNRILKACIALKPEGDEKWKPRNSITSDQLCLTSTRHFFEKCTENENFQIFKFTVFTLFSHQKDGIYQKLSKFYSLYSMT